MKLTLNLASRRYVNRRALNHGFIAAAALLVLFCLWSLVGLIEQHELLKQNRQQVAEIEQQLRVLRGGPVKPLSEEERSRIEAQFLIAQRLLEQDAFRWTKLLDRMEALLPAGVSINSFRPDFGKDSLALDGQARSLKEMRQFLDRLLKKGGFQQVYLNSHSRTKVRDYADNEREAVTFSVQLQGVF